MNLIFKILALITFGTCLLSMACGQDSICKKNLPLIDAHIHLYNTNREGSCTFLNPVKHEKIYAPHLAQDFKNTSLESGVKYAIVIEASMRREDNLWLLQEANTADNILACIGNLDPRHPEFEADLLDLKQYKKFRGIRIRPETPIDLTDQKVIETIGLLAQDSLTIELFNKQGNTSDIIAIAQKYPSMNIIINHLGGGRLKNGKLVSSEWINQMKNLSKEPNVYCKVSAIYTLSGEKPASVNMEFYEPLINPVLEAFGPNRIFFGSNWTLSEMRGSYGNLILILDEYCKEKSTLSREQFYVANALKAYRIDRKKLYE